MTIMAKKKKKKGRPSLLDLKKRSLKQQQQQLLSQKQSPNFFDFTPNPSGRSNLRYGGGGAASPETEFIAGADDDERKEKKHRLVLGLNSEPEANRATLSLNSSVVLGSDSNADGECDDSGVAPMRRKVSVVHGSNHMSGKVLKATENSIVHGSQSQVESGPGPTATPLPDKKLLMFILDRLQKKDTYGVFSDPVDPDELPDYHEIIENPMDFGTVRKKLDCGAYSTLEQFENDVLLICSNAMEYNSSDTIYFRQARSIQELAKKDFENLREESDDSDPPPPPKIVRRGRPPGKKIQKYNESNPFECVGPESFLNTTPPLAEENEHHNGTNSYNLRKNPISNKIRSANAVYGSFRVSLGTDSYPSYVYDWESEFPASVVRSVQKYGMKHFSVDENKRDTYKFPSASGDESSALALLEAKQKQLVEVGDACMERSYARSLARFAEDLGPVVRKVALNKIESALPSEFKLGRGESAVSQNQESLFLEQKKSLPNAGADNFACKLFPQSDIGSNSIQGSSNQSELTSFIPTQKSALQPCTSISNSNYLSYIPTQMGMSQPQILVPPLMLGMVSNESSLLTNTNRIDLGNFLPQGTALVSYQAPGFGIVRDASLQQWTNQLDSLPFLSDTNAGFWTPDSPSSVVQIGSPQQPDLALQLRMGW